MKKVTTVDPEQSRVHWESLEQFVRLRAQDFVQELLAEEVTELLGRGRSQRRTPVDAKPGYRNGHGKERKLTMSNGTITVRRPRVRGLEERFESRILPLFKRRTKEVADLLPELYLHGLSLGDFDLALRGLLGDDAPLSASTIARLKEKWQGELTAWSQRRLDDAEPVYLWVDGVYVKAGLEKEKTALLVVIAGMSDGRKEVLALVPGPRESERAWSAVLRDLKRRGLRAPRLIVGDGHLGIWAGLRNVYPEADEQRCWNHRILNVLDRVPKRDQAGARELLCAIPYAEARDKCEERKSIFQDWCEQRGLTGAAGVLDEDWDRMVAFYDFPEEHWTHLRTTNIIESPFAALRLRTNAAKRFKKVANATAIIFKMMMVAEKRFRRLNAPELVREVFVGVKFEDGKRVTTDQKDLAA